MTSYLSATLAWAIGLVLLSSGIRHFRNLAGLRLALADRSLPSVVRALAPAVAAAEATMGSALVVSQVLDLSARRIVLMAGAVWFAALTLDLIRTRLASPWATCGCPGTEGPVSTTVIVRAVALATACSWLATQDHGWRALGGFEQVTILLNAVALAVVVLLLPLLGPGRSPLDTART